jgi:pyruvate ferredoxin oxidoreductase gamma subunit
MYRVRFHGRGGQGIRTASRILGTALFREGLEVQDAPVYGAERRGAPIYANVRAARVPIHERGLVTQPDLVVVADETLVPMNAAGVLLGVAARTVVLLASGEQPERWRERLRISGAILAVSPDGIRPASLGALCAGAAARLLGIVGKATLADAAREELGEADCAVLQGFDRMHEHAGLVQEGAPIVASGYVPPDWIDLALEPARLAAPDIHGAATSTLANTGAWRTLRPVIDDALCNRCVWVCATLCPDSAIRADTAGAPVIDYGHCKGCLVCAAVCPPHAIRIVPEREAVPETQP